MFFGGERVLAEESTEYEWMLFGGFQLENTSKRLQMPKFEEKNHPERKYFIIINNTKKKT